MQKESSKFQVVDLVILHDKGVNIKQIKITNYQDLVWEIAMEYASESHLFCYGR